ncbi:MAG: exodeoxyribonuclease V subunit gamma [Peptostreptococcaceae bacterium]|nr:exodeoxyribonuclease V subunit gamma [Peptostreptococcaceae bacterium]
MLNILLSRYNKAVEDAVFAQAISAYYSGEEVYILVPEQFTLQNEVHLMEHLGETAVSRIKIMSFQRLALEALSKLGGLKRIPIDTMGKSMVLKNILYANKEELKLYAGSVDKEGFIDVLLNQIVELKRSRITTDMLRTYSEKLKGSELLSQKLSELAFIYEQFDAELCGKYVDNEDRLGQIAEMKSLPHLADKKIFIYSFLDFTAVEQKIIENLMRSAKSLTVGLCLDLESMEKKEETVFESTYRTLDLLRQSAAENGIVCHLGEFLFDEGVQSSDVAPGIRFLGDELFRIIPKVYVEPCEDIELFASHSIDEEIHHIARQISRKVVEEGYRYKDFMVTSGDLTSYAPAIKQIFEQYHIPFFIDEKRPIVNSPIVKVIVSAMNMLAGDFSLENMMVFLKNDIDYMGERVSRIYHFENYVLSKKLKRKMFLDDRFFVFENEEENSDSEDEISSVDSVNVDNSPEKILDQKEAFSNTTENEIIEFQNKIDFEKSIIQESVQGVRAEILNLFLPIIKEAEGKKTARAFGELVYDLLEKHQMPEKTQRLIDDLRKNNLLDEANENNQVWNIFVRIIEQASEVFGEEEMSFAIYKELVVQAMKAHRLAVIPPAQDQVIVGDVDRSRSGSKKILYLCGANSGSIPKVYQDSGVLTQEDKLLLADNGMQLPSERSRVDFNELLLLYILFTRATEKLCISYTSEGARLPSPLIANIKEIFPQLEEKNIRDFSAEDFVSMPRPTIDKMAREIKRLSKGEKADDLWREALSYYNEHEGIMTKSALDGIFYDNTKHRIQSAERIYPSPMKLSTTRLRSFEECPFKHFIQYGLRAQERKEYSIQPAEMGLVLHGTVEEVVRRLKNEPTQIAEITKEQMDNLVEDYFEKSAKKLLKDYDLVESRNQFLLKRLKKTAKKIGFTSVEHMRNGEFELLAQEARFDDYAEIPPIIVKIGEREIKLKGTIDRIDVLKDGERAFVKVIDYKTSNKEFSLSDAYNGLDIQLMVYLSAVLGSDKLTKTKNYPAGVFYFPVVEPILETQERSIEDLQELIKSQIKMDGIVLDEEIVLKGLDKEFDGNSKFKSEIYNSSAKNRLSERQFEALMNHINHNIEKSLVEILDGEISARPVIKNGNKEQTGCRFCRYASICRFEEELGDSYRAVYKYSNEDILKKLELRREADGDQVDGRTTTGD